MMAEPPLSVGRFQLSLTDPLPELARRSIDDTGLGRPRRRYPDLERLLGRLIRLAAYR